MRRTVPLLSGLAILGVVLNHSNWHVLRDLVVGDYTHGLPFLFIDQTTKFAVPAFVFIAGYFIAYATSEGKKELRWEVVRARVLGLTWPWLIWSLVMLLEQIVKARSFSLVDVPRSLFIQYYFVPLLLFYYLSSLLIVRWAKANPKGLLIAAGSIQLVMVAIFYLRIYWPGFPSNLYGVIDIGPVEYLRFAFYFPLGVVAGMNFRKIRAVLEPHKRWLPWTILLAYALEMAESLYAFGRGPAYYPIGADQTRLSSALFSLAILLTFMAYDHISLPFAKKISSLGTNTFGLYLSHYAFLGVISVVVRAKLPWVAERGWLMLPLFFVLALSCAILAMEIGKRLPFKGVYRVIFG